MKRILLCLLLGASLSSFAQFEAEDSRIANEFIVMLKPGHSLEEFLVSFSSLKVKRGLSKQMNIWLLERESNAGAEDFLTALKSNPHVKLAQFNHKVQQRSLIPNDTRFGEQWNMLNTGQNSGLPGADIEATEAWEINHDNVTKCGDSIVIAIIDGKFDLNHEDINYFYNYHEIPGNDLDDDSNGFVDDVSGWNVYDTNGLVQSTSFNAYHSVHCAGIAAAIGNNAKGIAGVCWGAKILPVVGTSELESEVVAAYDYVLTMRRLYNNTGGAKGAYVVSTNSSFGVGNYGADPADFPIWCAMYDSMGSEGIISAGAAPNNNVDVDLVHDVPSECPSNWFIGVTNTTRNELKSTAGWGRTSIKLGAPGTGILSTVPANAYQTMSGTSMATPHVAGAIGAMYAAACSAMCNEAHLHPDSVALLVRQYLFDAAEWTSSMNNLVKSNGRLNLLRAVSNMRLYNCDSCNYSVSTDKIPITCKGAHDGAMTVLFDHGTFTDYTYSWSSGQTSVEILSLTPGFYSVTVSDSSGCRRVATGEMHDPDSLRINSVSTAAATDSTAGAINVNATAGNEPLQYSLDGVNYQAQTSLSVPSNGTYTIYVRNQSGCVRQQSVVVSGIEDPVAIQQFALYPNPANDFLVIQCAASKPAMITLTIRDEIGQQMVELRRQLISSNEFKIDTRSFAGGMYFVEMKGDGVNIARKFVLNK